MKTIKKNKFWYKNIFLQSSFQFIGNTQEYFIQHSEKLVVFIIMPRVKNKENVIRLYQNGRLISEKKFSVSGNIFIYYLQWYLRYWQTILMYYKRNEQFVVIGFHQIFFLGMTLQKLFRKINFVFWIPDHFPGNNKYILLFEGLKRYYHDRIPYSCYLSDTINKIMNKGIVMKSNSRKTVMWGVKPLNIERKSAEKQFNLLFVGLMKRSQGLEYFFSFLKSHEEYKVYIIGICEEKLYNEHQDIIEKLKIKNQVFYPNKFFNDEQLQEVSMKCHVGVALYDNDPLSPTYYTDPGKIKAYTALGLPLIMSNVSGIVPYVKKFKCGEIVERNEKSIEEGLVKIMKNYQVYLNGVNKFNNFFYYETYYKERFRFLT